MEIISRYFTDFTDIQLKQFAGLDKLYRYWNEKINLISRKDLDGLYEKHVLHSLSIAAVFAFQPGSTIIDIGTGGGFPGIPLAIFFPESRFLLVDSIGKKIKVVEAIAKETGLSNITTLHGRVEEIRTAAQKKDLYTFDFAVSRAVAPLKDLWKWSRPLLKKTIPHHQQVKKSPSADRKNQEEINPGDQPGLICLKGGNLEAEILESGTSPYRLQINEIFAEPSFEGKQLLFVPR